MYYWKKEKTKFTQYIDCGQIHVYTRSSGSA